MTREQETELWRWAVRNKTFDLLTELHNMRNTFGALVGEENILLHDKYIIAERQLKVCELELQNLRTIIGNIDFK